MRPFYAAIAAGAIWTAASTAAVADPALLTGGALPGAACTASGGVECPAAIPDVHIGGVESSFAIAGCDVIEDVDVGLAVDHGWTGDLRAVLTSPAGTRVLVVDRPGAAGLEWGCGLDDVFAVLDDEAGAPVEDACDDQGGSAPAVSGELTPASPLAAFDGENGNGVWRLRISDYGAGDAGQLADWSLALTCHQADVDLALVKHAAGATHPGGTVFYTFEVTNTGADPATGVVVTDDLPAGLTYAADSCGAGVGEGDAADTFRWRLGTLAGGATAVCTLSAVVAADAAGTITNAAAVSSAQTDADPADNASAAVVAVGLFADGFESGDTTAWSGEAP